MDRLRQWSNVLFAVAQAAVPALGYAGVLGKTTDAEFQTVKTPVVPADYAFSIWSVIFLFCFVYAAAQARPSRAADPLLRRVGWLTAAAFAANSVWGLLAQFEYPLVLTAVVFLVTFAAMLVAVVRVFADTGPAGADRWRVGIAVGLLAGWVSVAIFANWSVALKDLGVGDEAKTPGLAIAFLSAAGVIAAAVAVRTRGALPYLAAVLWALAALVAGNLQRAEPIVAGASAVWFGALLAVGWRARLRGPVREVVTAEPVAS